MSPEDTDQTVYAVAFKDGKFLMVWNDKRKGWEMPGGHVRKGEDIEAAARREFQEEAGQDIEIVRVRDLGTCHVCAARLLENTGLNAEMRSELFTEIPQELFFDRAEYEEVIPWAKSALDCAD